MIVESSKFISVWDLLLRSFFAVYTYTVIKMMIWKVSIILLSLLLETVKGRSMFACKSSKVAIQNVEKISYANHTLVAKINNFTQPTELKVDIKDCHKEKLAGFNNLKTILTLQ